MESYYYSSGWPLATDVAQCNSAPNSDQLSLSVPTQKLPLASDLVASLQFGEFPAWSAPFEDNRAASASKSQVTDKRRKGLETGSMHSLQLSENSSPSLIRPSQRSKEKSHGITETDEVTIDYHQAQDEESYTKVNIFKENIIIKASVCCDDRPELFPELIQVIEGLRLTAGKADIASVGGRIKSMMVLVPKIVKRVIVFGLISTLKQSLLNCSISDSIVDKDHNYNEITIEQKTQKFSFEDD